MLAVKSWTGSFGIWGRDCLPTCLRPGLFTRSLAPHEKHSAGGDGHPRPRHQSAVQRCLNGPPGWPTAFLAAVLLPQLSAVVSCPSKREAPAAVGSTSHRRRWDRRCCRLPAGRQLPLWLGTLGTEFSFGDGPTTGATSHRTARYHTPKKVLSTLPVPSLSQATR